MVYEIVEMPHAISRKTNFKTKLINNNVYWFIWIVSDMSKWPKGIGSIKYVIIILLLFYKYMILFLSFERIYHKTSNKYKFVPKTCCSQLYYFVILQTKFIARLCNGVVVIVVFLHMWVWYRLCICCIGSKDAILHSTVQLKINEDLFK